MAESRGELEVYNVWFVAADLDRDGVLSGHEAVQFFQRSGLPQNPTLFKVWQYVAGDRPALSRQEFYTAMKLVSLAQLNGGVLDDQQALRLVNGLAGPVPLPRMAGMTVPRGIELPANLLPPEPAAASAPGQAAASPAAPPARGGAPLASPPPPAAAFPPLAAEQAAAFQTAFSQLDTDRDGFVQGTDCFGAFMQSGLPKAALKQIWDLVAGNEPRLNRHQFVQALYLIDCVKRGMAVPGALPPGPFPPVAGAANIATLSAGAPSDIYSATLVIPPMPPRQAYHPQPPPPMPFASQVPGLPADRVAALDQAERMRLEAEREATLVAEAEQRKAEEERAAAAAKREFFTRALGDLRLTQSKVNRAVAQEEKAGLAQKLESLRAMAAQLEEFDPEWESREKGECEALNLEIAELTVTNEQLQRRAAATERTRGAMLAQVAALKEAAAGVDAELATLTDEVDKVAAEGGKDKAAVVDLLKRPLCLRPCSGAAGFKIVSALPVDTRLTTYAAPSAAALEKDEEVGAAPVAPAAEGSTPAAAAAAAAGGAGDPPAAAAPLEGAASVAEAEAVSAAAEAGVLASAIAEALSAAPAAKPASKQGSLVAGGSGAAAAAAAAAAAEEEQAEAGAEADAAAPDAASNSFEAGVESGDTAAGGVAAPAPAAEAVDVFAAFDAVTAPAPVKQASGAFGSAQALAAESPKAGDAEVAAEGGEAAAASPAAAADDVPPASGSWTAF
ncbi:hypothetical protein CHLNCDRAFT_58481 [Chlorella variabilis]|uniref:EH domain-containing protein n=1 Tax=Chlorella variabilis TaxID=554065 RepID=E1ZKI7_CHLVA|nr:hypothetical protein CHLNCDRAFT_58481 [Chlorella variabilis]EFN53813.1 hypothetical protein CHLNCDRAFT_58481 [Chlorella variabilis]|eukprot:XP_005845915.1 hypothetical protein CHLNCDRAFT_58481 [Chlorella variabilis]